MELQNFTTGKTHKLGKLFLLDPLQWTNYTKYSRFCLWLLVSGAQYRKCCVAQFARFNIQQGCLLLEYLVGANEW